MIEENLVPKSKSTERQRIIAREGSFLAILSGAALAAGGAALAVFGKEKHAGKIPLLNADKVSETGIKSAGIIAAVTGAAIAFIGRASFNASRDAARLKEAQRNAARNEEGYVVLADEESQTPSVNITVNTRGSAQEQANEAAKDAVQQQSSATAKFTIVKSDETEEVENPTNKHTDALKTRQAKELANTGRAA